MSYHLRDLLEKFYLSSTAEMYFLYVSIEIFAGEKYS